MNVRKERDIGLFFIWVRFVTSDRPQPLTRFFLEEERVGGDEQTLQQTYSPREVQDAFKVLMTHWFCNSHDVSHFTAFFIGVGAKTSVAESV
jgi:hypothetical protein